jgi:hypothetical protein
LNTDKKDFNTIQSVNFQQIDDDTRSIAGSEWNSEKTIVGDGNAKPKEETCSKMVALEVRNW